MCAPPGGHARGMSEVTHEEAVKTMGKIIKDVKFAMLTTRTAGGELYSRPMTTQEREFDGDLWFIGSKDSEAVADMRERPQVNVSFSHPDKNNYVSVSGTAELVEDQAKLDDLWSDFYKAYFDGKEDPNIQLIKIHAQGGEFWESSGKLVSFFKMAQSAVTGAKPDMGKNDTVKL